MVRRGAALPVVSVLAIGSFLLLAGLSFGPTTRFKHHQALGVARDGEAVRAQPLSVVRYHGAFLGDPYVFYRHGMRMAGKSVPLLDRRLMGDESASALAGEAPGSRSLKLPYRDFDFQYPELAALYMGTLALLADSFDTYYHLLRLTQMTFFLGIIYFSYESAKLLARPFFSQSHYIFWVGAIALATGPRWLCYYDFLPAFFLGLLLFASLRQRWFLAGFSLTAGILSKVFPIFFVPIVVVMAWRDRGLQSVVKGLAASLVTGLVILSPWLALAPRHTFTGIRAQGGREYSEIGSGLGSLLLFGKNLGAWTFKDHSELESRVAMSELSRTLARASTPLLLIGVVAVFVWFLWRVRPKGEVGLRSRRLSAASFLLVLCAVYLFAKVFSPQYIVWTIPVILVVASFSWRAALSFCSASFLIQIQFPYLWALPPEKGDLALGIVLLLRNVGLILAGLFAAIDATRSSALQPQRP